MATILKTNTAGKFKVKVSIGSGADRSYKTKIMQGTTRTIGKLAAEWEQEVRDEHAAATAPKSDDDEIELSNDPTFAEVARMCDTETKLARQWSPGHAQNRARALYEIELSDLGSVRMSQLRRQDLVAHLAEYAERPTPSGKLRSAASIRARKIAIVAHVGYARNHPDIDVKGNPASGLIVGEGKNVAERDIPGVARLARLIATASAQWKLDVERNTIEGGRPGDEERVELFADVATFALLSGMRRGEIAALRTSDVTLVPDGTARVLVRRSAQIVRGEDVNMKRTKTDKHRVVSVPADAASILIARQVQTETRALADDIEPITDAFVFSAGWGDEPLHPEQLTRWWAKLRTYEAELHNLRLQDLRHAHASELHSLALHDAAIAGHMGHSIATTHRTYNHARPGSEATIAAAMQQASDGE